MTKDKVGALVILILSMVYGAMALNIPEAPGIEDSGVTPSSLPMALSATGIIAALLILILPADRHVRGKEVSFTAAFKGLDWRCAVLLFLLMTGYGLILKPLGFLISTIFFSLRWILDDGRTANQADAASFNRRNRQFLFILTQLLGIYLEPGVLRFLGESAINNR